MTSSHLNKPQLLASREMLTLPELHRLDAYWRACNYLCAGMIYLRDNPLLREPLRPEHFKNRLLGHWGSDPGQTFVWVHLNRVIRKYDLDMIYISGPGHGAPAVISNCYLEGTYSEIYPEKSQDEAGMLKLFRAFSFPGQLGKPLHAGGSGLDSRGRRTGLQHLARVWRGVRQPRSDCECGRGGRRGRDRAAGNLLAFQQIPESDPRWRRSADPASQRIQDRQSHGAGPHHSGGTRRSFQRLWLDAACRGGRRSRVDASEMAATVEACVQQIRAIQQRGQADRQAGACRAGR